jgi:hypothetical protein
MVTLSKLLEKKMSLFILNLSRIYGAYDREVHIFKREEGMSDL